MPWHLTTVEFVEHVAAHLAPGGTYVMNVIDYGDLDFVRSEVATLQTVFPHVAVFAPPTYLAAQAGGNFVLVASASPIPTEEIEAAIRARGGVEIGIANTALDPFVDGARPLTDDFAPVDQMIDRP